MTTRSVADVLIVGAGPAGLTLANYLATCGIPFRIIDPLREPVRESRAHGFGARTLLALETLGLVAPMVAAAKQPTPVLREYYGAKLATELDFAAAPHDAYPRLLPIFQQRVVRVLETALAERGRSVEWSTGLVTFKMDPEGVTAEVDRSGVRNTIRAGWIVGCDGGRSTVRKTLGIQFRGETSGLRIAACECDLDWKLSRDIWWMWHAKDGFASAIYNDFSNKWHVTTLDLEGGEPSLQKIAVLLRERSGMGNVQLSNPAWIRPVVLSQLVADHFLLGRAALVGDANHEFSSVAGQGLHFAIEDALNLGWKLGLTLSGAASPSLLQTYETERRERVEDVFRRTRFIGRVFKLTGKSARLLWATLYFVGKRLSSLTALADKQEGQLQTDYGKSSLSYQDPARATPRARAGLHAPDGECRAGGRPTRLLEVIRGPHANLLLFTGPSPTPDTMSALRAIEQQVASLAQHLRVHYVFPSQALASDAGMSENDSNAIVDGLEKLQMAFGIRAPEIVYLRPDGYIGLRTASLEGRKLIEYLGLIYSEGLLVQASADAVTRAQRPLFEGRKDAVSPRAGSGGLHP